MNRLPYDHNLRRERDISYFQTVLGACPVSAEGYACGLINTVGKTMIEQIREYQRLVLNPNAPLDDAGREALRLIGEKLEDQVRSILGLQVRTRPDGLPTGGQVTDGEPGFVR